MTVDWFSEEAEAVGGGPRDAMLGCDVGFVGVRVDDAGFCVAEARSAGLAATSTLLDGELRVMASGLVPFAILLENGSTSTGGEGGGGGLAIVAASSTGNGSPRAAGTLSDSFVGTFSCFVGASFTPAADDTSVVFSNGLGSKGLLVLQPFPRTGLSFTGLDAADPRPR